MAFTGFCGGIGVFNGGFEGADGVRPVVRCQSQHVAGVCSQAGVRFIARTPSSYIQRLQPWYRHKRRQSAEVHSHSTGRQGGRYRDQVAKIRPENHREILRLWRRRLPLSHLYTSPRNLRALRLRKIGFEGSWNRAQSTHSYRFRRER